MQPQLRPLPVIDPVYQYLSLFRFIETAEEVYNCTLPGTGLPHQGYSLSSLDLQIEILQYLFTLFIMERYIPETDISLNRRPVFPVGLKTVTVFPDYLCTVLYLRLCIKDRKGPFRCSLGILQLHENPAQLHYRIKKNHRI